MQMVALTSHQFLNGAKTPICEEWDEAGALQSLLPDAFAIPGRGAEEKKRSVACTGGNDLRALRPSWLWGGN
jgi:hypothetical protein